MKTISLPESVGPGVALFRSHLLPLLSLSLSWFLAVVPAFAQRPARGSIRVVTDNNYPPFSFRDEQGKLQGLLIDEWRLWEAQTGVKVQMFGLEWHKALQSMKAGEFDVIDTIFWTREWAQGLDFSQPCVTINVPIFFRKDISGITGLKSLKGFPVAAKAGDAIVDVFKNNGISTVLLFTNYQAIVQAAKERKVNVFVADQPSAVYLLHRQGLQDEFKQSEPVLVGHNHRAVQKGDAALLKTIEDGFASLNPEEVRQLEEKWYGKAIGSYPALRYLGYAAAAGLLLLLVLVFWNLALNRLVNRRTAALHQLSAHLLQVQDQERRRLARELHDTTAQHLAALSLNLNNFAGALPQTARAHSRPRAVNASNWPTRPPRKSALTLTCFILPCWRRWDSPERSRIMPRASPPAVASRSNWRLRRISAACPKTLSWPCSASSRRVWPTC